MVKKVYCSQCSKLIGAEDTVTGEREYIGGFRYWDDKPYCRDCYNEQVLNSTPTMGGIDGIEFDD